MRRLPLFFLVAIVLGLVSIVSAHAPQSWIVAVPQAPQNATPSTRPTFASTTMLRPSATTAMARPSVPTGVPTATVVPTLAPTATERAAFTATVSGYVRVVGSKAPIAGARVVVGTVEIVTGKDGTLPPTAIQLRDAVMDVDVKATAPGYQPWTFKGMTLRAAKSIELHVELQRQSTAAPPPVAPPRPTPATSGPPPEMITIGLTGSSACVVPSPHEAVPVFTMRFADYLRNVLPNEWVASWPNAALDAGAVAVKQYAWHTAFIARKWRNQGYTFDLLDSTCDQHYQPESYRPATDAALARTWWITLTRNGNLFPLYYRARDAQCAQRRIADCMGQWGSYDRAIAGATGTQILLHYYEPAVLMGQRDNYHVFIPAVLKP